MSTGDVSEILVGSDDIAPLELYGEGVLWRCGTPLKAGTKLIVGWQKGKQWFLCEVLGAYPCVGNPAVSGLYDITIRVVRKINKNTAPADYVMKLGNIF